MRHFHLAFTMLAMSLLAGCAGPQHKPEVAVSPAPAALVSPPVAAIPAPSVLDRQQRLLQQLAGLAPDADRGVLALALQARECALRSGEANEDARLAVIDYSMPSSQKRLWVFDVANDKLLFREHVSHGQGSGENIATRFSNVEGSYATSLGLYRTAETYIGGNGYSLRMGLAEDGIEMEESTLYPLLSRLESQGLLTSEWREEDKRKKRFYRLSPAGEAVLSRLHEEWRRISASLDRVLG